MKSIIFFMTVALSIITMMSAYSQESKAQMMPDSAYFATFRKKYQASGGTSLENDPIIMNEFRYYKIASRDVDFAKLFAGIDLAKSGSKPTDGLSSSQRESSDESRCFILRYDKDYYIIRVFHKYKVFRIMHAMKLPDGEFRPHRGDLLRDVTIPELYDRLEFLFYKGEPTETTHD